MRGYKDKIKELTKYNIQVLKNKNQKIGKINLIGIDDLELPINKISYVNNLKKDKLFNIVISHKPDIWDSLKDKIDLMLSGHTHNGQIFPFNFVVKLKFKYIYWNFNK